MCVLSIARGSMSMIKFAVIASVTVTYIVVNFFKQSSCPHFKRDTEKTLV